MPSDGLLFSFFILPSPFIREIRNSLILNTMPKDIPRLQWFGGGGDTRSPSSVWLGFAQLLMPKEYDRVEAIRRHRREVKLKRKAEVEADAEAAAAETVTAQQVIAYAGDAEGNKAGEAAADRSAVGEVEGEGEQTSRLKRPA
jgi:hypothetical protein